MLDLDSKVGYILGFKMKVDKAGYESDNHLQYEATAIGTLSILKHETIKHNNEEKLNAKCTEYDKSTGIATFMFGKPMHEMALPEAFIETAKGINDEYNCELIIVK